MFLPTAGESGPLSPLLPPSLLTTMLGAWQQARASLGRWGHGALFGKQEGNGPLDERAAMVMDSEVDDTILDFTIFNSSAEGVPHSSMS